MESRQGTTRCEQQGGNERSLLDERTGRLEGLTEPVVAPARSAPAPLGASFDEATKGFDIQG